jgi:ribosomal protein L29
MGKKANKWKAKYDELMRITEAYIRHLHDAHARLRFHHDDGDDMHPHSLHWDCEDCAYDQSIAQNDIPVAPGRALRDERIQELKSDIQSLEQELAETREHRETQEAESEQTISNLEDERHRLECRVDELSVAIDDLLEAALNARVTRVTISDASGQLDPGQRVHLFEGDWDKLIEACREARCTLEGLEGRA